MLRIKDAQIFDIFHLSLFGFRPLLFACTRVKRSDHFDGYSPFDLVQSKFCKRADRIILTGSLYVIEPNLNVIDRQMSVFSSDGNGRRK